MATTTTRTEEQIVAAVAAGHEMAGMPLTAANEAAVRRVVRGETTGDQEVATLLAELRNR